MNLLFLNVGRRCELVEAFRRALGSRGGGLIFGSDISEMAPARSVVDHFFLLPRSDSPDFLTALAEQYRRYSFDLLIPSIDPDLERLDILRDQLASACPRMRLLLPPSYTIRQSADKRLSRSLFAQLGVPVPEALHSAVAANALPVFGKPAHGSSGNGAAIIDSVHLLRHRICTEKELMLEKIVEGPEYTVDVLCSLTGKALVAVPRRRLLQRAGEVSQGVVERLPELEALARGLAEGFRATGPVTIQFRRPEPQRFVAMEMNARMGGGLPLTIAAGGDWPGWILDMLADRPPRIRPEAIADGLRMTRYDRSCFLPPVNTAEPLPETPCEAVLFDLDDTLYPEADFVLGGYRAVAERVWRDHGVDIEPALRRRFLSGSRGDHFSPALLQTGLPVDEDYVRELVALYRGHTPSLRPYLDARILDNLAAAGIRLGLVSDGLHQVQEAKLDALGLRDRFSAVVFSDAIEGRATWKPSPRPFVECLRLLRVTPEAAWYVGDNPLKDFIAPRQLGMVGVRIRRPGTLYEDTSPPCREAQPQVTLASLGELPAMLGLAQELRGASRTRNPKVLP